jgi:catalase
VHPTYLPRSGNSNHIPVNAPKCPFHSYHRDGAMRTDGNLGRTPTYFPNSRSEWVDQPLLNEPPLPIDGAAAKHIQERHIANCTKADPGYGAGVAQAIARLDGGRGYLPKHDPEGL